MSTLKQVIASVLLLTCVAGCARPESDPALASTDAEEARQAADSPAGVDAQESAASVAPNLTKVGAFVTGAGGSGVAVDPETNMCTYMHMGAGGVALGGGVQKYKLVLLFEDDESFERFVDGQWDGGATAQAVAGKAAAEAASNFVDGMAAYQVTDAGLIAQADLTLLKYWQHQDALTTESEALRCAS